ncbi:MAG: hypothetical protein IJL74_00685 [Bacilli bacterium]|nr:hypothetical protein [Bacilli bacterium]
MEKLTANETLDLLNKQWADTNDIKKLACCGTNRAGLIKQEIKQQLGDKYFLPKGLVPMDKLFDYLNININYLRKISKN